MDSKTKVISIKEDRGIRTLIFEDTETDKRYEIMTYWKEVAPPSHDSLYARIFTLKPQWIREEA
jgi:hypothetical protein